MQKKDFIIFLIIIGIYFFYQQNHLPSTVNGRVQVPVGASDKGEKYNFYSDNHTKLNISGMERYYVTAKVVSKANYSSGWNSKISPYDLALAWGRLMDPDCLSTVSYWQSNRWYYYRFTDKFPLDKGYIISHSSNNHIIPSNDTILKVLASVKVGQVITLDGYLVDIAGKDGNYNVGWNSSRSREDSGDGSCELFYVSRVIKDGKTYI